MVGSLGMTELVIILAVALLIFGPSRLPKIGRAIGDTVREWRGIGRAIEEEEK